MRLERETLIASLVIFLLMIGAVFAFFIFSSGRSLTVKEAITVYVTPYDENAEILDQTQLPAPTEQERLPGVFGINYPVIIQNTGGEGLRIRDEPGLDTTPLFLGREGEKFQIIDGPAIKDSIIWWKIESEEDPDRKGWAAQDYLEILDE